MRPAWSLITYVEFPIKSQLLIWNVRMKLIAKCNTYITLVFQVNHNSYIIIIAYLDKDLTFAFFFGYIMFYYLNKHIKFIIIWCKGVTINCRIWYITYDKHIELENTGTLLPFCTRNRGIVFFYRLKQFKRCILNIHEITPLP